MSLNEINQLERFSPPASEKDLHAAITSHQDEQLEECREANTKAFPDFELVPGKHKAFR